MIKPLRYLVLLLTTECNLECAYCYRGGQQKQGQSMPCEMAEKALHLASMSGLPFHVQLTGGEPTLKPELVERIASLIREKKWPATIGIQTNGTILGNGIIHGNYLTKIFKRYEIQVGVSLDGPPDIHEKMRGRTAETLKGLKLLTDQDIPFRVTTVVTEQNIHVMDKLVLLISSFSSVRGLGLDLLVTRGNALKGNALKNDIIATHPSSQDLKNGLKKLLQALNWVNENRSNPVKLRELELIKQAAKGSKSAQFCHAAKGEAMAVHPDGSVYPCAQTMGDPYFYCGTIDSFNYLSLNQMGGYHLVNKNCGNCILSGFCPGDCPSRQYYNDARAGKLTCVMYQTLWKEYTNT